MNKLAVIVTAILLVGACSKGQLQRATSPDTRAQRHLASVEVVRTAAQPTVDRRSSEAAENLVQGFAELLNNGRFDEAYMLLGAGAPPRKSFDAQLSQLQRLNVDVHPAGDQEGAAGSVYVTVPLTLTGTMNGKRISRRATATVRRVNDVPGSTEAQRHWHIERIAFEH